VFKQRTLKSEHEENIEYRSLLISDTTTSHRCVHDIDESIAQLTLVWLDESVNEYSFDSLRTKALLRDISKNNCLFIDDADEFQKTIATMAHERIKMLVVMSESYAVKILASIQVQYPNIVDICTEYEVLQTVLQRVAASLTSDLFINQKFKSIRPLSPLKGIDNSNFYFSYILFIEVLKQMQQTEESNEIMLNACKDYYLKYGSYHQHIEEFRENYSLKTAIDWYIKEFFVYRLINRAFRTEDITLWKTSQCIRGQPHMPTNELKSLQSNLDCQIAANGLLSTSKYGSIARVFIVEVTNTSEFKVVIFQITVDASNLKNVVFVDINQYIGKADENESEKKILFNIKGVNYESESDIWIIKMEVTDENVSELKKQEIKRMKLSSDHPEIGTTFNNIGNCYKAIAMNT
ncbi:unnamed protein product, partial [Rotaria magnacalcarata]